MENNKKSSKGVLIAVLAGAVLAFIVGVLVLVSGVLHRNGAGNDPSSAAESVSESIGTSSGETSFSANEIEVTSIPKNPNASEESAAESVPEDLHLFLGPGTVQALPHLLGQFLVGAFLGKLDLKT